MASPVVNYPPGPPYAPAYYNSSSSFNPTIAIIIIVFVCGSLVLGFIAVFVRKCMTDQTTLIAGNMERSRVWSLTKPRGLDKAAVNSLPIVHSTDLDEKADRECPVCLTEFEPEDTLRLLPVCKHVFHQECIDAWFDEHSTCPLCRARLTDQPGVVSVDWRGEEQLGAPREPVETVIEVSENGDSDIELRPVADAVAPLEESRAEATTAPTPNKPPTAPGTRKPSLAPAAATGIRRASSLGTDLIALRNLLTTSDQSGPNSSSYGLNRTRSAVPKSDAPPSSSWFTRGRNMELAAPDPSLLSEHSREHWSSISLEAGSTSKGESSKAPAMAGPAPEWLWSDRWSLASLRSAIFPPRSTSDVSSRETSLLPV